jgi:hypothetical protein
MRSQEQEKGQEGHDKQEEQKDQGEQYRKLEPLEGQLCLEEDLRFWKTEGQKELNQGLGAESLEEQRTEELGGLRGARKLKET